MAGSVTVLVFLSGRLWLPSECLQCSVMRAQGAEGAVLQQCCECCALSSELPVLAGLAAVLGSWERVKAQRLTPTRNSHGIKCEEKKNISSRLPFWLVGTERFTALHTAVFSFTRFTLMQTVVFPLTQKGNKSLVKVVQLSPS